MQVHEISGFISQLYLIEYPEKLLLLDGGCRHDLKAVEKFIVEELNRSLDDLKLVVVTHAHPDHSGGAIDYINRGIKVAATKTCNDWYQGMEGLATYIIDIGLTYFVAKRLKRPFRNIQFPRYIEFDKELVDGDLLPGFEDWSVISTPGHTHCDISLYHQAQNVAYVGDNMISLRNKVIRPYPLSCPDSYRTSLRKYIDLGVTDFLLAHYGKCNVTPAEIQQLIDNAPKSPRNHKTTLTKALLKRIYK